MRYQDLLVTVGILYTLLSPTPALAQSVLEKVVKTGVLTAGTSQDAFPFAYKDKNGRFTGYSVDMLILIQKQVEKKLKRPIRLELIVLNPADRIAKLKNGTVDIVCDVASFTWDRDRDVDFTVSYSTTGTQLLTRKVGSKKQSWDATALAGRRIGALPGTTNEQSIRRAQPKAQIVLLKDRSDGYKALRDNKIDAFADDGILLEAWLQRTANNRKFEIGSTLYSKEGIACMVPENNSAFLDSANYALIRFMQGVLNGKKSYVETFDRWFGSQSILPLSNDMRESILENMRLVIDAKQEVPKDDL